MQRKTKLENGLRVITLPMKGNPTVTVLVLVEAGSQYETPQNNGISHFLEHMCFKGTVNRPTAMDISHELDGLGAAYNAFTGEEYTGYYAKGRAKHFGKLFDVVSDIYLNSTLPAEEIEKEKGVITEEINMYEDLPQRKVYDVLNELMYGNQPAGMTILGPKKNIANMKKRDFTLYREAHYVPAKTIVVASGDITHRDVLKEAKKYFSELPKKQRKTKKAVTIKLKNPQIKIQQKKTDQSHFVIGMHSFPAKHKKNPSISLLAAILGTGMSSRLFEKLRNEMGVCYYVRAANAAESDHGVFAISAGVDNKRLKEVLKVIMGELEKLKNELVTPRELRKAREFVIGNFLMGLEQSDDMAMYFGHKEIVGAPDATQNQIASGLRSVTPQDIRNVARELFQNRNLNLAVIGPQKESDLKKTFCL